MKNDRLLIIVSSAIIALVVLGLFILEFFTENDIFNETINGMVIGQSFGWIGAYIAFYTTSKEDDKNE